MTLIIVMIAFMLSIDIHAVLSWLAEHWSELTALLLSFLTGLGFKAPRWLQWVFDVLGYIFKRKVNKTSA